MNKYIDYPLYRIAAMVFRNLGGGRIAENFQETLPAQWKERLVASDNLFCIKRGNRKIVLTSFENRLILILAAYLSQFSHDEDFKKCLDEIEKDYMNARPFTCSVDLKWVAKMLFRRCDFKRIKKIREHLNDLSTKRQVVAFTVKIGNKNKTVVYDTPLLSINEGFLIGDEEEVDLCKINISFGKFFLWKFASQYSDIPEPLFNILGKKNMGTDTAIFFPMLNFLLYNWGFAIAKFNHAEENLLQEIKNKGIKVNPSELKKELSNKKKDSLKFSETLDYFVQQSGSSSYTTQRHTDRLKKDIKQAVEVFKQINLISDCRKVNVGGKVMLQFTYQPSYGHSPIIIPQKR